MIDKRFLNKIKKQIENEICELESNANSREQASETVELDQSSTGRLTRMDAMQQQAMAKENLRRATLRSQQLQAALIRIKNDEFGHCLKCNEKIFTKRLLANPITTLCINCAEAQENF